MVLQSRHVSISRGLLSEYILRTSLVALCSTQLGLLQGSSYLLGQRFSAYFVLKVAPQRGEGEKREGVQISKNSTQNL